MSVFFVFLRYQSRLLTSLDCGQLPNDSLSLRQPIHIKSLTYISSSNSASTSAHIVTGTETGDVRRYDTRAARRPVANWTGIGKVGGIGIVQASPHEQ